MNFIIDLKVNDPTKEHGKQLVQGLSTAITIEDINEDEAHRLLSNSKWDIEGCVKDRMKEILYSRK